MKLDPHIRFGPGHRSLVLLPGLLWLLLGCSIGPGDQLERRRQTQEIWEEHEAAVIRALDGHQENDEFVHAVDFFARVTAIEIDVDVFTLGYLPTPQTREDLERVRDWYSERKDDLYFDPVSQSVVVQSD